MHCFSSVLQSRVFRWVVCLIGLLLCINAPVFAAGGQAATYIELYGLVNPQSNPHYNRVVKIFEKIKRVSKLASSSAELVMVNSDGYPWAIALQDGNIVLSAGAVELIYSASTLEISDAWMSFVIGHELAHIRNGDHLSGSVDLMVDGSELIKLRELKADNDGFLYASLAGFNTKHLFGGDDDSQSFLHFWSQQTGTFSKKTYRSTDVRATALQQRFQLLQSRVDLFHYGVRLAHFGRYEDALLFFRAFQNHYKSHAVLNNLGYVYLQLARKKMPASLAYRFWFPTLLEMGSGLQWGAIDVPQRSYFGEELPPSAIHDLQQAVIFLSEAIAFTNATESLHINLVVAFWYLGDLHDARAAVENALERWPHNKQLISLRALVLLEQSPATEVDMWSSARRIFESLVSGESTERYVLFNLAALLTERGRLGDAKNYWRQLANDTKGVPPPYLSIVCTRYECKDESTENQGQKNALVPPIDIGADTADAKSRRFLSGWHRDAITLGAVQADIYSHPDGDSLLALDYIVEIYTSQSPDYTMRIPTSPDSIVPTSNGSIFSYGSHLAAVAEDDVVSEMWFAR